MKMPDQPDGRVRAWLALLSGLATSIRVRIVGYVPCQREAVDLRLGYMQDRIDGCRDTLGVIMLSAEQRHGAIVVVELLLVGLLLRGRRETKIDDLKYER
jgi:hypothetical protein